MTALEKELREAIESEIRRNPHYLISASDMATDLIPVIIKVIQGRAGRLLRLQSNLSSLRN